MAFRAGFRGIAAGAGALPIFLRRGTDWRRRLGLRRGGRRRSGAAKFFGKPGPPLDIFCAMPHTGLREAACGAAAAGLCRGSGSPPPFVQHQPWRRAV